MARLLVSGTINLETTLRVDGFPIAYAPLHFPFHGVNSTISGVGYNITKALHTLGDEVAFLSLVGRDMAGHLAIQELAREGLPSENVIAEMEKTAQSVILYDSSGRRQIHVDLKELQDQRYPEDRAGEILASCNLAVLSNINFSRPLLAQACRKGVMIATDVHTIGDLEDPYNLDFMEAAQILFMSHENLPDGPEEWANRLFNRFRVDIVGIGLGSGGVLLGVRKDHVMERIPAVTIRPVLNTIGAGDALFSGFLHSYNQSGDPYTAIKRAVVFAGYKIGAVGAAEGFLSDQALHELIQKVENPLDQMS